jgi:DNA polymerase-1
MSLCIVDGYNFVFRAFHSLPPLTTSEGIPVGAVYGFVNMIAKLVEDNDCEMLAIALDSGKKTFRHEMYPDYKANRDEPDESLKTQFPIIREAIEALNVKAIEIPGYEADDIIAAYTRLAEEQNLKVKIISSDKDLVQLVRPNIEIFDPLKRRFFDDKLVWEKFGIKPEQMIDFLAMVGDASDNIPGVKKVGPKTAAKLLAQFDTLEKIYTNLEEVWPERVRGLLADARDIAFLSQELVTLKDEGFNLPYDLAELKCQAVDQDVLQVFMQKYEFKSLSARKSVPLPAKKQSVPLPNSKTVQATGLVGLFDEIYAYGQFYLHIIDEKFSCYFGGDIYNVEGSKEEILERIADLVELIGKEASIKLVAYDMKSFISHFSNVQFQAYDDLSLLFYTLNTGHKFANIADVLSVLGISAAEDVNAFTIYQLAQNLQEQLLKERKFFIYAEIEKPLLSLLVVMEQKGVLICAKTLKSLSEEFNANMHKLETEIYQLAGQEFNIASPKQIGEIIFDKLKVAVGKKSKKSGAYITDAETLEGLAAQGIMIVKHILKWRQFAKLVGTYTEALQKVIAADGRVHTTFSMITTTTSRLSSHDPNLQNIPVRTTEGSRIREAFIAAEGCQIIAADYSQIELRILAHMADIKMLQEAFKRNEDIHKTTAAQIFNVKLTAVDHELRRKAKAINFGIIYGISAFGLANNLAIDKKAAQDYIDAYFAQYPGIKEYMDETIAQAKKYGYVETIMGRKCFIDKINDRNFNIRNFAQRAAINAPIQASAAEVIKKAMLNLDVDLKQYLILQVHDELLFEVPLALVDEVSKKIKQAMQNIIKLSVPLLVDVSAGKNWYEAKS